MRHRAARAGCLTRHRRRAGAAGRYRSWAGAAVLTAAGALATACGGSQPSAAVPSLSGAAGHGSTAPASQAARLHAAAECVRQHGIPAYQDPVLTPTGALYTDARSFQNASASAVGTVRAACRDLMAQAGLGDPTHEAPAPPALVRAGARAAECERAHGLLALRDPTAQTPYTPGHGFGMTGDEVPAGGKGSPGFQQAVHACHQLIDAEIRASTLASLASDG
jgi:hypothetical protein